jgi:hypothetical protein
MSESISTREEQLARMTAHIEDIQRENPGVDLKIDAQWWMPVMHFGADIKVHSLSSHIEKGIFYSNYILSFAIGNTRLRNE